MEFKRSSPLTRRHFLAASGAAVVAGCSQTPSLQLVKDGFSMIGGGSSTYPRTRPEIDATPYAQLGVRIGDAARGIMVLSEKNGDDLHWISANRILLITHQSRIVKTVGLQADLSATLFFGPDLLDQYDFEAPKAPRDSLRRNLDIGSSFGLSVLSKFTIEGDETISILGNSYDTVRVREDMESSDSRWRHPNRYWLSKRSKLAWRSVQYVSPDMAPIEMELLKRPD